MDQPIVLSTQIASILERPVTRDVLADQLVELRTSHPNLRVVLANGCFEMLHVGHVRYLKDARSRGDFLVVAVNEDVGVQSLKGDQRSLVPFAERAELLLALECVDAVMGFGELTLEDTLRCLLPAVHAKGTDYTADTIPERFVDRELGIEIAICGDPKDHSTTAMLRELGQRESSGSAQTRQT
ncbi:MAG: rfaE bifunctional protein nucleotidyltransferase chain/domain [Planctomycetota bacterium]|jgi:rfaE bifunctional protein nucleotidyltransferase chain/domain